MAAIISVIIALIAGLLVYFFVVPWQKRKILGTGPPAKATFTFEDSYGKWTQIMYRKNFFSMIASDL